FSSWHGTHVAGTLAAATNNDLGVAGIAWDAKVMPIRALGLEGGTSYDILQGMYYAAGLSNDSGTVPDQTADIINLSLGGSSYSVAEQSAITTIHDAGVIIVAASGNDGSS
ncbi:S8 family serine peptidase, partial [Wenyingzhuangia sp. 1_MG-2023]|nr:S8 family serine peptidase [Wenyingzhuangia sp. 1_MG-2023]